MNRRFCPILKSAVLSHYQNWRFCPVFKIGCFVSSKLAILSRFQNRLFCLTLKSAVLSRIHERVTTEAYHPRGFFIEGTSEATTVKWNNKPHPLQILFLTQLFLHAVLDTFSSLLKLSVTQKKLWKRCYAEYGETF